MKTFQPHPSQGVGVFCCLNLRAEQQTLLASILYQMFRKDYWVKGARTLSKLEQTEALRAQRVILVQPRADVSLKVNGSLGEATMQEGVYNPILDLLADHKAKSLGQIEQALKAAGTPIGLAQIQLEAHVGAGLYQSLMKKQQ